ncbi:MAG: NifU family protein [Arcobacteraceae bacterium]|jgi:Fe-S cluster biogenesis protein NfuA|nr:NifU family protein [Arcobacteraceae bacterium]
MMPFSDEDLDYPINNIINTKITPMLAKDGGAIKLLKIKNGVVYIQLQGACVGCASSGTTLKFIVEKNLKELIHPELEIKNIPFGFEDQIPND